MPFDQQLIDQEQKLLAIHRRTLAVLIQQLALLGGAAYATPGILNAIQEARTNIRSIKAYLSENGIQVEDDPNDDAPSHAEPIQPLRDGGDVVSGDGVAGDKIAGDKWTINTESGDYATGNIDKRTGIFGGTIQGIGIGVNQGTVNITSATTPAPALHQLRAPIRNFVGREQEIDHLMQSLSKDINRSMVSAISGIRGMGGMGKTELAYVVANQLKPIFSNAQLLIELHGSSEQPLTPEQVLQRVILSFERETKLPDDLSQLQALYRDKLSDKHVLILVDDAKDASQIRPLLPPPGSALLVTSRHRFYLPGMVTIDLGVLEKEEAERLLADICPRIGQHAEELAILCGYLPLALRVSAGLLRENDDLDLTLYLKQLNTKRLNYLRDIDNPDDPQGGVEASLALSYYNLNPVAQKVLCHLSVFPGSFDPIAATAVLDVASNIGVLTLQLLHRHSLLEWDSSHRRYNLHDLVREFAASRLPEEEAIIVRRLHATYFLKLIEETEDTLVGKRRVAWLEQLDREVVNLRTALQWAHHAYEVVLELRLANALTPFWLEGRDLQLGYNWMQHALNSNSGIPLPIRAKAFAGLGAMARVLSQLIQAQGHYQKSLELFRDGGHSYQEAKVLHEMGILAADRAQRVVAEEYFEASRALFERLSDRSGMGSALSGLGGITLDSTTRYNYYRKASDLLSQSDNLREYAWVKLRLGRHYTSTNEYKEALIYFDASLQLFRDIQDTEGIAWALLRKGVVLSEVFDYSEAAICLNESLKLFKKRETATAIAWCLCILSQINLMQGQIKLARKDVRDSLLLFHKKTFQPGIVKCLEISAILLVDVNPWHSIQLFSASEKYRLLPEPIRRPIHINSPIYQQKIQEAKAQIGEEIFVTMWTKGQIMSLEEAVDLAIQAKYEYDELSP